MQKQEAGQTARVEVVDPIEEQIRDDEQSIVVAETQGRPALAYLIEKDAATIKRVLENREMIVSHAREVAIKKSDPQGWTIFKDREGVGFAVPRADALLRMRSWLGIETYNHQPKGPNGPEPLMAVIEEEETEWRTVDGRNKKVKTGAKVTINTATMRCDAKCAFTGSVYNAIEFTAREDRFAGTGSMADLRASCRTGLESKAVRIMSGLTKVSLAEMAALKGATFEAKAYKGHGSGSSTERTAGRVAEKGVREQAVELRDEILRRVSGDESAAKDLLKDITKWTKDGKENWLRSTDQMTQGFQVEKAWANLKKHPAFGDDKAGGGDGAPEPGSEG